MIKRIGSLTLLILMLFSVQIYGFTDLTASDWFYKDINSLQTQGVISGYSDGTFKPYANVSNAEALKMVFCVAGVEVESAKAYSHWASSYYYKAKELDYIPLNMELRMLDSAITRQAVANLIVKVLELDKEDIDINLDTFKDTQDESVNTLYSIGVINGIKEDGVLFFKPNNLITRAEISAILIRTQKYIAVKAANLEKSEKLDAKYAILNEWGLNKPVKYSDIDFSSDPYSTEELEKVFLYMASSGVYEYTVKYSTRAYQLVSNPEYKAMVTKALSIVHGKYPEFFSYMNELSYQISGNDETSSVKFILANSNFTIQEVESMRSAFEAEAIHVLISLIQDNKISNEMNDKEKAKVLFNWIIKFTSYDNSFDLESYTGYGQIVNKKAVCQGYTATYNYMCKLLGLDVQGISGTAGSNQEDHIWTLIDLDGEIFHIDATWGDSFGTEEANYSYFVVTSDIIKRTHNWDSEIYGD